MPVILKYTEAQYKAKISELEGYLGRLKEHKENMKTLKGDMYNFWDDPNAQKAGEALAVQIHQVENAMERTMDLLNFYNKSVEQLGGTNSGIGELLEDALGILGTLGI